MIKQDPKMASETIPPPPPPPLPLLNNDNTNANGPTTSQVQSPDNAEPSTSTNGAKSWERAWTVDEMRKGATNWSLASDAGLLLYMQEFSQNMLSQTHSMEQKVDGLVHETKGISAKVHNTFNDFLMLSNTQFIENRVYDEEETKDEEEKHEETVAQEKEKTREELETEVIPKINEAIQCGLAVLDSAFVTVEITPEQVSDDEDEGTIPENLKPDPILELTDVYAHRKLPSFIGSAEFQKDDLVGLEESSSEDEGSDKEASMESETEKSTEDENSSGTETVSGSSSESEEESSTATESEDEKEVVVKKKARKESLQAESDDELFAAGGTVKSTKSKVAEADDSDESMEDDDEKEEQPRKVGVPMDFSSELAAKLGVKPRKPVDDSDEEADNEDDWGESERRESKSSKDDLFSASVDTAASVSSKGSRRKDKKHKKPKSRSGSHASHDSGTTAAVAAGNVSNELERHDEDDDDQDNLFTSSIDTTSSVVSKGGKSKHKHKNKASRSDSQVSNSSSKSGHKEKKAASNKNENNLFSGSPEGDLFDESSPFAKKGGMFSGGGGLFDDVMEDDDDDTPSKPETLDNDVSKTSHEQDESDEENVKQKPRTPSGKKLPAGAVAIFGDHGPFGHMPLQTNEHHVAKSSTPEKTVSKTSTGGGLFSDEGEDIFTSSQSSSVVSNKPPAAVPAKATKSVDLFGSGDDEGDDDDSLFGTKAPKKIEQKAETPKKKLPAGAVSIFGSGSPPPLFSASNTENAQTSPAAGSAANAKAGKETSGLFDEDDDKTSSFNSERSSVPSIAPKVQTKRKTNQISLFDDNDDDDFGDGDGNDLFSSIAPSKTLRPTTNKTVSTHEPARDGKATDVSKPAPKRSTISLFDDDEDEDDDDEDIFTIKPSTKSKPPVVKPSTKSSTLTSGLFASEEDPLFSGSKPQAVADAVDAVDKKTDVKTDKEESSVLNVDGDDLFAKPKTEDTAVSVPEKKEVNENSDDLFDEDSDEKDEVDAVKPGRKILPGAVPMFGGVDIFAGQKPGKATKAKPQDDSLFADDENDLFAAPPKPVPTVVPRTVKPRKPPVEKPTSSSPLEGSKEQAISSSDKNTNVGKLQKTLAFNPAAMLPGAARPPKKQDTTTETVVRNKDPIIFNPATMLPGAVPPPRKQENVVEATFDKPASAKTLDTSGKDRARVGGKRRPPTRQARKKAAKDSMDDTSLFGSNLTPPTASNERLAGTAGGQPSLFSDSSDLFSSSSYKSSTKDKLKSHTTQSQASKFDPLFIHNSMSSDLPSFEDSIDGISSDSAKNKKDNVSNLQGNKNKADALFNDLLKDDLFSTSTESDSSFLPKSNIGKHVSNEQESAQKSKSVVDKKQKDDLFSLSTESESSIIQKSEVVPQSVPKPDDTKKSSIEKKLNDDLFNQSTESNISQKARRKEKSDIDSLFENKPTDDLFRRSDNDISSKMKPKEDVSAKKTQNVKTDPLFNSKPNDDLLSELTNNIISQKEKPSTAKTTSQTSSVDPLTNDDLFTQPTKSDTLQKSEQKEDFSAQQDEKSKGDPLFNNNKPKNDLESNITEQAKLSPSAAKSPNQEIDPIFDSKPKDNPFSQSVESNKSSSQKVQVVEDDDDDEDDLFKPNRPLFTPPPLDFDSELGASGDFTTEQKSKTVSDDIFNDDDDIFAPKASRKKVSNNKAEEKTKSKKTNDQEETVQEKPKPSDQKNSNDVDDLFAGTGSIFDDLPKKSKEKKKKKATAAKEENIFDDTKGASEGASTSKTTKKTKGKKKGKSQISIFDEDSPSIFDDPLNATLK